jgi:SP family arabinose:H+ symporter-like MFS transporter
MSEHAAVSITKVVPKIAPRPKTGIHSALVISTVVSTLAGFLFGYDNIVISGAIHYLAQYYRLDPVGVGWAAGCGLVGCLFGSALAGLVADKFGLRSSLYGCAACFALSSIGVWMAPTFSLYVAWRLVGGIGIGAASIVAPMYIAEIAPQRVRGRLVVLYQLGIVVGILSAVFVNLTIEKAGDELWNSEHGWRWMFAVGAIPAALFGAAILFSKESPRWLMKVGRERQAFQVLTSINGSQIAAAEVTSIRHSLLHEQGGAAELFGGPFRRALITGFILAALTQLSGITSVLSFLPEVLKAAGQNANDSFFQAVLVGVVNVLFTCCAIWLVDRAGRKTLILTGTAAQALALVSVGLLYRAHTIGPGVLIGIMFFVAGHAVGNGAVCWVIISEIFPTKVRGAAMSIATSALWMSAYLANQFFPLMQKHLGNPGTFFFFSAMATANFIFVLTRVPETKGYALEDNSRIWAKYGKKGLTA